MQHADIKGYQFSREDVDARSLANLYAQYMGNVFTHEMKPLEVEILVAEVGPEPGEDQLFHILYDGTVVDEDRYTVLGGEAEAITGPPGRRLRGRLGPRPRPLSGSVRPPWPARSDQLVAAELEVAVLARSNGRRAFRRVLDDNEVARPPSGRAAPAQAVTDAADERPQSAGSAAGAGPQPLSPGPSLSARRGVDLDPGDGTGSPVATGLGRPAAWPMNGRHDAAASQHGRPRQLAGGATGTPQRPTRGRPGRPG